MNVKELKLLIKDLPDDMEVITEHWEQSENGTSWPVEDRILYGSKCLADRSVISDPKTYPHTDGRKKNPFYEVFKLS